MWLETASMSGGGSGTSPLVRYEEVVWLDSVPDDDPPRWARCRLRLRDGSWVPCRATITTMRQRLRALERQQREEEVASLAHSRDVRLHLGS